MKKTALAVSVISALAASGIALGSPIDDELAAIKARLKALEEQVQAQNDVIREKDRQIQELVSNPSIRESPEGHRWTDSIEVGGVIELEAGHVSSDGDDESDIVAATVEVGIAAQINDWVAAETTLLYEEETDNNGDLNVDVAIVTIADPDSNWFVAGGIMYVPFGTFDTNMISDPLTLDLGETSDTAILAGMKFGAVTGTVYTFQGDRDDQIENFGAALNVEMGGEDMQFAGHIGYINDIGETDGLFETIDDGIGFADDDDTAGWAASARLDAGPFAFIAEYVAAVDDVPGTDDQPEAFNLEAGFSFDLVGKPAVFALAYQGTDGYENIDPTVSEKRVGGALTVEIFEGTSVALEYRNDEDYNGDDADTVTAKVAVEF